MRESNQPSGRIAALDLGEVRTGVAISDAGKTLARPLEVVPSPQLSDYLHSIIKQEQISEIVVGVPKTMSGEIGFQARRVLERLQSLREEFPDVVFTQRDERLTTRLAVAEKDATKKKGRGQKKKERVDHLAAARMLQEHLDARGRF